MLRRKEENYQPSINKERDFFTPLLSSFKKHTQESGRSNISGRFRISGAGGQSVIGYFIVFACVAAVTAVGVSTLLTKTREGGEGVFKKALTRISVGGNSMEFFICHTVFACTRKPTGPHGDIEWMCHGESSKKIKILPLTGNNITTFYNDPSLIEMSLSEFMELSGVNLGAGTHTIYLNADCNFECDYVSGGTYGNYQISKYQPPTATDCTKTTTLILN